MEPKKIYGQCRCCLSKGYHKDIMKEYHCNGLREVYYEIFMECYNLFLTTSNVSKLICSPCVQRLRDANSFKAMVVESERQLQGTLGDKETVFVNVPGRELETELDIKMEDHTVKIEPVDEQDTFISDNSSDSLSHVSTNECMVAGEEMLLARFERGQLKLPTRDSLYTICPTYVKHLDTLKGKTVLPKVIEAFLETDPFRKLFRFSRKVYITEKLAHISNAATILENSNATPFKSRSRTGYPCFYCRHTCDNLDKLREHQVRLHRKNDIKKVLATYGGECLVVYIDITDLKCTICNEDITTVSNLKLHLTKTHNKKFHTKFSDRVIPFKLSEDNMYKCQVCGFNFETFGSIERHMNTHYRNYVCHECGTGFVTKYRLKVHVKSMHLAGNFPCEVCKKVFSSQQKLKNHVDTVHKLMKRFKCPKCPERFSEYFRRQKHMTAIHGVAPLRYKCNVCEKDFDRRYTLSRHMKRDHLEERDYQCEICSYKSFTSNEMRVHMIKHNGERIFECSVCKKSYARKKTLKEHMRIHNNDRRFACAVCGQAFVQKCSLKGHIKTHHVEYN